jgi:dihydrofolate synthase/folylpolyglutamate synthase
MNPAWKFALPGFLTPMATEQEYQQCLKDMFSLRRFGIKLGLSTIRHILAQLGNPQDKLRCIHVAGTNGKGSVAASLAAVLKACGYKTGLYTSPHLVHFNERIVIDGRPISDERVVESYRMIQNVHRGERAPTFFEFATAMAMAEFAHRKVDWAVMEAGMGGRLDATNIISPELCIITNISLEHREYLGQTVSKIAAEKAGIIKSGVPVVTGVRQRDAVAEICSIAESKGAPVYRYGHDFRIRRQDEKIFTYRGIDTTWRALQTSLKGDFQLGNLALALASCEILGRTRIQVTENCIRSGLVNTHWPGRLEWVSESPAILLDGAHNLMAARRLADYLTRHLADRKIVLVVGILSDKPYRAMLKALVPACHRVVITRPKTNRALPPETLCTVAEKMTDRVRVIPNIDEAVTYAVNTAAADEAVCIAGSLYVVGDAKQALASMGFGAAEERRQPSQIQA